MRRHPYTKAGAKAQLHKAQKLLTYDFCKAREAK